MLFRSALQAFSQAQGVKISYDDQGQLVDHGSADSAKAIVDLVTKDWGYNLNMADLDPKDPLVNTASEYMFEMGAISHHTLTGKTTVVLAADVTAGDGTGIVHSAPAYGVDDYNSCLAHGMTPNDILNPVQGQGAYAADFALFGGQHIWKAVPVILQTLRDAGRLMSTTPITHSYPHCWRHKTPEIGRAYV